MCSGRVDNSCSASDNRHVTVNKNVDIKLSVYDTSGTTQRKHRLIYKWLLHDNHLGCIEKPFMIYIAIDLPRLTSLYWAKKLVFILVFYDEVNLFVAVIYIYISI